MKSENTDAQERGVRELMVTRSFELASGNEIVMDASISRVVGPLFKPEKFRRSG